MPKVVLVSQRMVMGILLTFAGKVDVKFALFFNCSETVMEAIGKL